MPDPKKKLFTTIEILARMEEIGDENPDATADEIFQLFQDDKDLPIQTEEPSQKLSGE